MLAPILREIGRQKPLPRYRPRAVHEDSPDPLTARSRADAYETFHVQMVPNTESGSPR
jgi:hypothetical protein